MIAVLSPFIDAQLDAPGDDRGVMRVDRDSSQGFVWVHLVRCMGGDLRSLRNLKVFEDVADPYCGYVDEKENNFFFKLQLPDGAKHVKKGLTKYRRV